ncbi:hypothetical protein TNCV_1225221 [Trichonephila clavipes]|nr:hypothetical protein TNCV_1225221 [Trichonephila clavipes]
MSGSISIPRNIYPYLPETESAQDDFAGCLRTQWPWGKTPPITMVRSRLSEAITQLLALAKVVFFTDSQAAISALSSNTPTDCLNTIQC